METKPNALTGTSLSSTSGQTTQKSITLQNSENKYIPQNSSETFGLMAILNLALLLWTLLATLRVTLQKNWPTETTKTTTITQFTTLQKNTPSAKNGLKNTTNKHSHEDM
ncbi:hypothetical protein phiMH2Kp11 [Bdellovibrio phage phiMH2K]|uniref:Uncharacterized protein N n=1 Tax=Bdellovibrio phage phiMH2K TaxID=145579 RepID=N_BPPHM|nr:hypothetical protein phiMH2Kp11 [Bdellovibrio phage phiMH2K]Q9G049.1 RecName: Full=Uncharacterized protein N [Bdellovibrio phage phiMH2K]AAG45350.1 orfN [Bdellovibrio phage phiMH2K]